MRCVIVAFFATALGAGCAAQAAPRKPLTTVRAVIHLSGSQAQSGYPVRLRGQITYVDLEWNMMFARGATGSVFVVLPERTRHLQIGDVVLIRGVTGASPSGNYVEHIQVDALARRPLPKPRRIDLAALSAGAGESQYIATEGILRPNKFLWDHTHLLLVDGHTSIPIVIPGGMNTAPLRLVGNRVVVRGVAGARTNSQGERVGAVLYLQSVSAIHPASAHWRNFALAPVMSIVSLRKLDVDQRFLRAVHLRGRVLWHSAHEFALEDASGTVLVKTPSSPRLQVGDQLDVVGFPGVRNDLDHIEGAVIHDLRHDPRKLVPSVRLSAAQALRHGKEGEAVTMSGTLMSEARKGGNYVFQMADHGLHFEVLLGSEASGPQTLTIRPGSRLEASGTLRFLRRLEQRSRSVQLLVNSPADIVIESGRGVNWREFLFALGSCILLGIGFWIIQMRRALRANTMLIRAQMMHESQLEDRYRRLFERSPAAIFIWRPSGEITDCNPAFARMLGFNSPADIVGRSYWHLCAEDSDQPGPLGPLLASGAVNDRESSLRRSDGRSVYLLENVTRVEAEDGHQYETTALDITQSRLDRLELQRAKVAAQREAEIDALTGLANRRRFSQVAKRQLELAAEQRMRVGLLFLDLDGFKAINDTLGHLVGDMLLQHVARRLKDQLSAGDVLSRLGGDEFAILLREPASVADPEGVAAAMLGSLTAPFQIAGRELTIGSSIGISLFPEQAFDYTNLLQQADGAMYAAKQAGRNRAVRYNDEMGRTLREKNQIAAELKGAMIRGEISLHYQPEFDRVNRHIVRFEALARWNSPVLGNVPPTQFISVAEESGLIAELGKYLLEAACRDAVGWQQKTGERIPVAVNISFLQLRNEGFAEMVLDILTRTGLPPDSLEMEMTESVMLGEFDRCREVLMHLRACGIKLALDDFGTGYSSLSYLPELPFDRLKIDRSFLQKVDRGGETLIDVVISLAHRLGISVVAEGIETSEELNFLHTVGPDEVQGFLLGRPGSNPSSIIAKHLVGRLTKAHAQSEVARTPVVSHRLNAAET